MVPDSFGPGLCCSQVVFLGTASVDRGEEASHRRRISLGETPVRKAEQKRGALRPRGSGGLQQGAGGREVGGVCVCVLGVGWGSHLVP